MQPPVLTFTLDGYQRMFQLNVGRWAINSFLVAGVVTITTVLFAALAGYAISRIRFRGSRPLFLVILGTMMVPGIVMLIPMFIILKSLGMLDSYSGLMVPKMVGAFGVFLMAQFFESIPIEIEEAARMDGADKRMLMASYRGPGRAPASDTLFAAAPVAQQAPAVVASARPTPMKPWSENSATSHGRPVASSASSTAPR